MQEAEEDGESEDESDNDAEDKESSEKQKKKRKKEVSPVCLVSGIRLVQCCSSPQYCLTLQEDEAHDLAKVMI